MSSRRCNAHPVQRHKGPPRWNITGKWFCAYPVIRECAPPRYLPVEAVNIEKDDLLDLGLGMSAFSKEQV